MNKSGSARQGLGYFRQQAELLGTGQNKPTFGRVLIDYPLKVGNNFRNPLDFIKYRALFIALQKISWILRCTLPGIRIFKCNIISIPE